MQYNDITFKALLCLDWHILSDTVFRSLKEKIAQQRITQNVSPSLNDENLYIAVWHLGSQPLNDHVVTPAMCNVITWLTAQLTCYSDRESERDSNLRKGWGGRRVIKSFGACYKSVIGWNASLSAGCKIGRLSHVSAKQNPLSVLRSTHNSQHTTRSM
jgi:hypothetical protein